MVNSTCLPTSISDLLDNADRNLLNLTATIASCPEICPLAWGQGDPDLLGIGVFISYIMQAVLAILCGPVLGLTYTYLRLDSRDKDCLSEIAYSFIDTSIGFNIPLGIASTVRMAQSLTFFDQTFSAYLLGMQLFSFLVVMLTTTIFAQREDNSTRWFCFDIQLVLSFVALQLEAWSNWRWLSTRQLLESCKQDSLIFAFVIPSEKQWTSGRRHRNIIWLSVSLSVLVLCIAGPLTVKTLRLLVLGNSWEIIKAKLERVYARARGYAWARRHAVRLTVCGIVSMTAPLLLQISLLIVGRSKLKAIIRADLQDQWSFGQIIAVFLWVPLCLKIIYFLIAFAWERSHLKWVEKVKRRISEIEGGTPMVDNRSINDIECDTQMIDNRRSSDIEGNTQMVDNRRIEADTQRSDNQQPDLNASKLEPEPLHQKVQ